ncbi:MAG: HAMP domain-containing histidine kinase [Bacteroidales bacterium]|nr:HAMP domain-containing histidine kinase [Bacteroidales bacterium]
MKRKNALIILSIVMGVVWVMLLITHVHLINRVIVMEKQFFQAKVDVAALKAFDKIQPAYDTEASHCLNAQFFDTLLFDSAFSQALREQSIFEDFVWGVYCTNEEKFVYATANADTVMLQSSRFSYSLSAYNNSDNLHHFVFYLDFPLVKRHSSWDMFIGFVLLSILLAVFLFCFITIIILIIKESKVRRFRSNIMNHVIHEFKTPITTISLATQLLRDDMVHKDPESTQNYLSMIDAEAQSLQSLVEEVLTVFRSEQIPSRELREISLHELLQAVVNVHQLALQDCGAVTYLDLQAKKDVILGDRIHLLNAFSNLIDNAIKYRNGDLEINISTQNIGNMIEIRFKDNGIGISKENQNMIFEPFSRVNVDNANYVKGYGLGLSYVRNVVKFHGGKIKVESDFGDGATFIVSLPINN